GEFDRKNFYIQHRIEATNRIADFLRQQHAHVAYQKEIMCCKLILKRLILSNTKKTEKWIDLYPESDRFIFSTGLPKLFKLMLWAASRGNVSLVNLSKNLLIQKNNLSESIRRLLPS